MPAGPLEIKVFEQDRAQFTHNGRPQWAMEFEQFCHGKPQNFANWPAEFGKIFHGKLWALIISCHTLNCDTWKHHIVIITSTISKWLNMATQLQGH